jgi:hypothetical protein
MVNLWDLWRGEWRNAKPSARARLNFGLVVLLVAVAVFGVASALKAPDQPAPETPAAQTTR